ncbi:uncharacterized protein LOC119102594 isoform X1 [Pollicipes pollicipes]|uniref:uncharacterized protein LOC119102594 isoform X1 n=1 Tax=Pollicipes pollicipes TaxID=41117 RepID=UPI001884BBBC|nr:uncharacterized protein LOC119102594 isoform X1 [Pollicipes pollicipes]
MPSCYAFGCTSNSIKEDCEELRFFCIPTSQRDQERRRLWLAAIRRKGEPYKDAKICSTHFVSWTYDTGCPARWWDKQHPDYVPSKFEFPASHMSVGDPQKDLRRYRRAQKISQRSALTDCVLVDSLIETTQGAGKCEQVEDTFNFSEIVPDGESAEGSQTQAQLPTAKIHVSMRGNGEQLMMFAVGCIGFCNTNYTDSVLTDASTNTDGGCSVVTEDVKRLRIIIDMFRDANERLTEENAALKAENEELKKSYSQFNKVTNRNGLMHVVSVFSRRGIECIRYILHHMPFPAWQPKGISLGPMLCPLCSTGKVFQAPQCFLCLHHLEDQNPDDRQQARSW